MKKIIIILFFLFPMIGCTQTNNNAVTFEFTAVGDNGSVGQASFYDIRYSTDTLILMAWDSALQVTGEPLPKTAGSAEEFTISVHFPEEELYYFAIRVGDDNNNWSGNSNTVERIPIDNVAPNAIMNFRVRF